MFNDCILCFDNIIQYQDIRTIISHFDSKFGISQIFISHFFFVFSEFSKPIWLIFCFFYKISEYFLGFENPEKTKKNEKNILCFKTRKMQSKSGKEKEKHKKILRA
jgi:hypothetical protein